MAQYKQSGKSQIQGLKKLSKEFETSIALLSIKPNFAEKILSGSKKYEYRKTAINKNLSHILIYSTSPVKKIIGIAEIEEIFSSSPTTIWEMTKHSAGISRKLFREYFRGKKAAYALKIKNVIPFERFVSPKEINKNITIPQSYKYVDNAFYQEVIGKGGL